MMRAMLRATCVAAIAVASLAPVAMAQIMPPGFKATTPRPATPPTPARLPDGTPNITGFWVVPWGLLDVNRGPGGIGGPKAQMHGVVENVAPLKSPYKERFAKFLADAKKGIVADKSVLCYPQGFPRMMIAPYGLEILQVPGIIAMTSEYGPSTRRIWLNRKHTPEDELDPSYYGESVGHWEGDTLMIDTIGMRDDVPLDFLGLPHSAKMHVTEKLRYTQPGVLTDSITIDDPDVYEHPWTMDKDYRYRPDLRLSEYVCQDNNRDVGPNGEAVFKNH